MIYGIGGSVKVDYIKYYPDYGITYINEIFNWEQKNSTTIYSYFYSVSGDYGISLTWYDNQNNIIFPTNFNIELTYWMNNDVYMPSLDSFTYTYTSTNVKKYYFVWRYYGDAGEHCKTFKITNTDLNLSFILENGQQTGNS